MLNTSISNSPIKQKTTKSRGIKSPFTNVLERAMRKFKNQITQNDVVKRQCIEYFIPKYYQDRMRFWTDFIAETERLLDSKKFEKECVGFGRDPKIVAEHLVFEGRTVVNNVLKNGLKEHQQLVVLFVKPIFIYKYNLLAPIEQPNEDTEVK